MQMTKPKEGCGGVLWQEGGSLYLSHKKGRLEKRPAAKNHTKSASLQRYSSARRRSRWWRRFIRRPAERTQRHRGDNKDSRGERDTAPRPSAGCRSETFISRNTANMRMARREWRWCQHRITGWRTNSRQGKNFESTSSGKLKQKKKHLI